LNFAGRLVWDDFKRYAQFGGKWWKHRQWAKVNFDEWLRLVWWQAVDRWRG